MEYEVILCFLLKYHEREVSQVNRLARKQLHLNQEVLERPKEE